MRRAPRRQMCDAVRNAGTPADRRAEILAGLETNPQIHWGVLSEPSNSYAEIRPILDTETDLETTVSGSDETTYSTANQQVLAPNDKDWE